MHSFYEGITENRTSDHWTPAWEFMWKRRESFYCDCESQERQVSKEEDLGALFAGPHWGATIFLKARLRDSSSAAQQDKEHWC